MIAYLKEGDYNNSNRTYNLGNETWDGVGFKDTAYNAIIGYDTFKLALYILASKTLNRPYDMVAYNNLLSCQLTSGVGGLADAGGFASYYYGKGVTNNQTNTETTALAILALDYTLSIPAPSPVPMTPEFQTPILALALLIASSLLIAIILQRRKTNKNCQSNNAA